MNRAQGWDDHIFIPQGVKLQHRRANCRIVITLPANNTHEGKHSHSLSYNPGENDIFIGRNPMGGHVARISRRRAELQCSAWACAWYVEAYPLASPEILEACETCVGVELSMQLSHWDS